MDLLPKQEFLDHILDLYLITKNKYFKKRLFARRNVREVSGSFVVANFPWHKPVFVDIQQYGCGYGFNAIGLELIITCYSYYIFFIVLRASEILTLHKVTHCSSFPFKDLISNSLFRTSLDRLLTRLSAFSFSLCRDVHFFDNSLSL